MKHIAGIIALCATAFLLTACSSRKPEESKAFIQYAQSLPPITVPPGVPDPVGEAYYPIPEVPMKAPLGTKPPLEPPR